MPGGHESSSIRCGVARVDISPAPGTELAGYPFVRRPCRGTHDPLYATAMVFDSNGASAAIIALDVLAVGPSLVGTIREHIHRRLGIPPDHVLVCATHTHSAPALPLGPAADPGVYGAADPAYTGGLPACVHEACDAAAAARRPIALTLGHAWVDGVASNRRHPGGVTDSRVTALFARDPTGQVVGVVLNFACHPTVLHADNALASSDVVWAARRVVEERLGGIALYTTGAAGDQSTRHTRRAATFDEADRLGSIVGEEAAACAPRANALAGTRVGGRRRHVTLPLRRLPSRQDAERHLARAEDHLAALTAAGAPGPALRTAEVEVFGARHTARWVKDDAGASGAAASGARAEVQVLAIGDLRIAGLPVELFAEDGLRLQAGTKAPLIVVCYANDMLGYAPPPAAFHEGGYEPSSTLLGPEAKDRVLDAALELLQAVQV